MLANFGELAPTMRQSAPHIRRWNGRQGLNATSGGAGVTVGERMGLRAGMTVQEFGWDDDVDDDLRVQLEDAVDADLVDGDYGDVVDAVVLWWRAEDGDLVDALVDALTDLVRGGAIWLMAPKV